jgi:hypothetical protein
MPSRPGGVGEAVAAGGELLGLLGDLREAELQLPGERDGLQRGPGLGGEVVQQPPVGPGQPAIGAGPGSDVPTTSPRCRTGTTIDFAPAIDPSAGSDPGAKAGARAGSVTGVLSE